MTSETVQVYHLFWDASDERYHDRARTEAHYQALGDIAKRLYIETYADQEAYENDEMLDEDCLLANGPYPS